MLGLWGGEMKFKLGDKVRLKNYTEWNDYRRHEYEVATIIGKSYLQAFDFFIQWSDGATSGVYISNLIKEDYMFNVGDIVTGGARDKCKILAVCGELIALSDDNNYEKCFGWYTKEELKECGFKLVDEKEEKVVTMQEIADKFGVDVDNLKVEKGE